MPSSFSPGLSVIGAVRPVVMLGSLSALSLATDIGGGKHEAIGARRWEANAVVAGCEIGEVIIAFAVRRGGADGNASGIVERDGHAFDAGFANVLNAIAIQIKPDEIADASER